MRKPLSERSSERYVWLRSFHVQNYRREVQDLELELLKRIVAKLETLSETFSEDRGELLEMYKLLFLLEMSKERAALEQTATEQSTKQSIEEVKSSVDWARLLPLLLAVGVVLGVIIAELLGLDMRRVL